MLRLDRFRRWLVYSLLGLCFSWLFSCTPQSPPTPTVKEVEFWTMQLQPQFTPYFNTLIQKFEQDHQGVKIRWVDVPWTAMESKILSAVSAKTAPDVVNLNPTFASQLASKNAWFSLNDKISPDIQKSYLPNIWQASTLDNTSFGIPWYLTTKVTFYNQTLLKNAGISQPPQTYEALAKVAQTVKEKTGKYAFFIPFVVGDSNEVLESMVQMGVTLVQPDGKAGFNTPEGLKAFRYWVDLYQKDLLPPEILTQGHRQSIDLYQAGELAFLTSGAEFFKTIETNSPDVAKVTGVTSQITGDTGKKNVAVMNLVIPKDTDQPDLAVQFALFVTNTENQLAFTQAANVLPSTLEGVKRYMTNLQAGDSTLEQARKISAGQLMQAEVLIPAMKNLNQLQKVIYENLQSAMLKQKTVEQALQDAAQQWNSFHS